MTDPDVATRLAAEARIVLKGHLLTRLEDDEVVVDLTREDGSILWPGYSRGPDELLALLAAEQRFLVEQEGRGTVSGETYLDKARERVRRAAESADT